MIDLDAGDRQVLATERGNPVAADTDLVVAKAANALIAAGKKAQIGWQCRQRIGAGCAQLGAQQQAGFARQRQDPSGQRMSLDETDVRAQRAAVATQLCAERPASARIDRIAGTQDWKCTRLNSSH